MAKPPASLDKLRTFFLTQGFAYAPDGLDEALVVDLLAVSKPFQQLLAVVHPVTILNQPQKYLVGFALQSNAAGTKLSSCLWRSR